MDRIAPTRRPNARPSGHQTWEKLLFVHYAFPKEVVRPLVPKELELDLWEDGLAWVGLVPFEMKGIRPAFVPVGLDFLETNLRTYVSRKDEPGVFFSLSKRARFWRWKRRASGGGCPISTPTCPSEKKGTA